MISAEVGELLQVQGQSGVHGEFPASLEQSETLPQKVRTNKIIIIIVFQIKEKEEAQQKYREAISQGHGAYLMDQDTPVQPVTHPAVCYGKLEVGKHARNQDHFHHSALLSFLLNATHGSTPHNLCP